MAAVVVTYPDGQIQAVQANAFSGAVTVEVGLNINQQAQGAGSGDVVGPSSAVDSRIAVFNGTTGKLLKDGGSTVANVLNTDNHTSGSTNKVYTATEQSKLAGIEDSADVTDAANVAAAGAFMKSTDDADDITTGSTNKFATAAEKTKLGYITVTQAVDLDAIETRVNNLDAAVVLVGSWDASAGTFPGSGSAQAGESWVVSVAGTVGGVDFNVGDRILAITDNASTATYASNWLILDYTDKVSTVAGKTGAVTLDANDVSETATKKWLSDTEQSKLAGIEASADVTDAANVGSSITGSSAKTTPVDADQLALIDSAASNVLKKVTWANIKATLQTAFNSVYAAVSHSHAATDITSGTLDGDRLPGLSTTKKGGVPATGTPSGLFLKDNGTWDTPAGGGGSGSSMVLDGAGEVAGSVNGSNQLFTVSAGAYVAGKLFVFRNGKQITNFTETSPAAGTFTIDTAPLTGDEITAIYSTSDVSLNGGNLTGSLNFKQGADIASATTTDIANATGNFINITGTTTITGLGTVQAGAHRWVKFAAALTLTHNATSLILPTAANITTAAGDTALFVSEGSGNWRCHYYMRANGKPLNRADIRVTSITSSTTPTPNADTTDQYNITALAAGATFGSPTGTPSAGQNLVIRVTDNGGAQTLAFNAIYRAVGVTLPTTTVAGKTLYIGCKYNSNAAKWDVLATAQEA